MASLSCAAHQAGINHFFEGLEAFNRVLVGDFAVGEELFAGRLAEIVKAVVDCLLDSGCIVGTFGKIRDVSRIGYFPQGKSAGRQLLVILFDELVFDSRS